MENDEKRKHEKAAATVNVHPGEDIAGIVASSPNWTKFIFAPGTYRNLSIKPKDGQQFIGNVDVNGNLVSILDGGGSTPQAFQPTGSNSNLVKHFIIQHYAPPLNWPTISLGGKGIIDDNEVRYNATGGIGVPSNGQVLDNWTHHNGQYGITGGAVGCLIEGNEIDHNNAAHYQITIAGGTKFSGAQGLTVNNNYVHDNYGPGLWCDHYCQNNTFDSNHTSNNLGAGIAIEISHGAAITNNLVENEGLTAVGGSPRAGIVAMASDNVTVSGNRVSNCWNAIIGVNYDRGVDPNTGLPLLVKELRVEGNTINEPIQLASGIQKGATISVDIYTTWGNVWNGNVYGLTDSAAKAYIWAMTAMTKDQWKQTGNDATGNWAPPPVRHRHRHRHWERKPEE
jgi:parallel beta-helix repeat protein